MPKRRTLSRRFVRLTLFSVAAWGFLALGRGPDRRPAPVRYEPVQDAPAPGWASAPASDRPRARSRRRRMATSFAFAVLFCAGASFSAVAGDELVEAVEGAEPALAEEAPGEEAPAEEAPADAPAEEAAAEAPAPEPAPAEEPGLEAEPAPEASAPEASGSEPQASEAPAEEAAEPVAEPVPAEAAPAPEASGSEPQTDDAAAPAAEEAAAPAADAPAEEPSLELASAGPVRSVGAARPKSAATGKRAPSAVRPRPLRPKPEEHRHLDPEVSAPGTAATVWLARTAPDPTPAALRLAPSVASRLVGEARAAGVDWALVLGVLRAEGARGRVPARPTRIAEAADRLATLGARRDAWGSALAYTGRTGGADRAVALARYYRAIGVQALVRGLMAEQDALTRRVLADPRVTVYPGGRADLEAGRIDVRVVALVAYLAEAHGQVTVSSLFSGHRFYSRPGVVSAHMYGAAVDIAALGGVTITPHTQGRGSVTERAVRDILLLPNEMRPRQLISLIGMGGPSFPLADHDDHIHVGY